MSQQGTREERDYYQLLQVHPRAPNDLIAEVYWHLATRLQGRRGEDGQVDWTLRALNTAYSTLINPESRAFYDQSCPRVRAVLSREPPTLKSRPRRSFLGRARDGKSPRAGGRHLDLYELLLVDREAEVNVISLAYAFQRQHVGYDVWVGRADPEVLEVLAEAFAVFSDPERRSAYDATLRAPPVPPPASALPAPPPVETPAVASARGHGTTEVRTASRLAAGMARTMAYALWRGLVMAVLLSHRFAVWAWPIVRERSRQFVAWAWPIVRERSRQFAAWAWPIVKEWSRRLAAWAWLVTKALARGAARAARQAIGRTLARCRERRPSAGTIDDRAVRSRLSSALTPDRRTGPAGDCQPLAGLSLPAARLIVEVGPQAGAVFELQREPVTLGAGSGCSLRLTGDDGRVAPEHARIWRRQGRFMIHQLAAGQPCILIAGRPMPWAVLEDGDRIEIGEHVVRFELVGPDVEA